MIDGEAVVLGVDGVSDFNALHSRKHDAEVQLYPFDILALGGEDLRTLALTMRKTNLARLLRGRPDGMFIAPFEAGEIGPELFHAACGMGLEGLVSKKRPTLWRRPVERLDQSQEPDAPGDDAGVLEEDVVSETGVWECDTYRAATCVGDFAGGTESKVKSNRLSFIPLVVPGAIRNRFGGASCGRA